MSYRRRIWVLEAPGAELRLFSSRVRAEHFAETWSLTYPNDPPCIVTEFVEAETSPTGATEP